MNDIQGYFGYLLILILVVGVHIFFIRLVWCGVRSLLGKPVNLPPSNIRWFRTRATVVQDEETSRYQAIYYFEDEEYTAYIDGFTVYGNKAIIYVKRSTPTVVKEYIPQPPMGTEASAAYPVYCQTYPVSGYHDLILTEYVFLPLKKGILL